MRSGLFLTVFATILFCVGCGGAGRGKVKTSAKSPNAPTLYSYKVKNTYPHSTSSYTQGLIWQEGKLIEGIGEYGHSALLRVNLMDGSVIDEVKLSAQYFGEGIAELNGKIYQLTWQEGKVFVYNAKTFDKVDEFSIPGEGWGVTSDGTWLYMSDGSDKIYQIDPKDFSRKQTISVRTHVNSVPMLNELEWIKGEIWANVYMSDFIVRIDPKTGSVKGVVDLSGILPEKDKTVNTDVLNGIAYDSVANRLFVTGKNWPKLFEIEVIEK